MTEPFVQLPLPEPGADVDLPAAWEARRLRPLLQTWTPEALSRVFFLSTEDRAQVQTCRGSHNRLGFGLQLVLMRFLHIVLPDLARVPEPVLHFISLQLDLNPAVLAAYGTRGQTRDAHSAQIRTYLGLRLFAADDGPPLQGYLVQRAMHRDDAGVLVAEAEAWLRRHHILFPAIGTLQRLVATARTLADAEVYAVIARQMTPARQAALDALLTRSQGRRGSTFAWLKAPAPHASVPAILELRDKRQAILATDVVGLDLTALNRNRVRQLAQLGQTYHAGALRRFDDAKRTAILVCLLHDLAQSVTDDLLAMLDVLIGRIFSQAAHERDMLFAQQGKAINANLHLFRRVAAVLLDPAVSDDLVRAQAFAQVPQAQLQQAYDQSAALIQPEDFNSFTFLVTRYPHLRSFLPAVLAAVPFTGTDAAQPTLAGLAAIHALDTAKPRWKKLPVGTPCGFVTESWKAVVAPEPGVIDHRFWMLCLAEQLRSQLRSADILVPGSRQHQAWTSYLHSDAAWQARKASWFSAWHGSPDVDAYLTQVEAQFAATVQQVADGWEANPFARFADDQLVLARDEKVEIPASARALRQAAVDLLPRMKLPDILIEVNRWVNFRSAFTHPNDTARRGPDGRDAPFDATLFAVILAQGCNLPLTTMAEASSLSYHQLVHTADWYVRESTVREAIIALVDYHHGLPLATTFGAGTSAMSDGIRFGVTARSLYARHNPRLPTRTRGVTVYDMTSDQGSQPYLDVIRCDIRESAAVLDAALHHETELPLKEHFTDTHGYTELIFGLFELESRIFSPRIRDLPSQVLYPLRRDDRQGPLGRLFRGPLINRERIRANWDEMHRIAASLQDGTVTAQLLVSKLQALKQQRGAHTGIQELGRIFKTLAALSYISDEAYRRRIHHTLNKGELLHALAREVFFGQQGLFRERDYAGQLNRATCMSLIINAIVVWNTRYLLAAVEELRRQGMVITDGDLGHLTPLVWEHITMHGSYHFDVHVPQQLRELRPLRVRRVPAPNAGDDDEGDG